MAEYRVLVDHAMNGQWDLVLACAWSRGFHPNSPMPPLRRDGLDSRPHPCIGILDSLFPPTWVARTRSDPQLLRERLALAYPDQWFPRDALSAEWEHLVRIAPGSGWPEGVGTEVALGLPLEIRRHADVVQFAFLEMCPRWLRKELFWFATGGRDLLAQLDELRLQGTDEGTRGGLL